MEAGNSPKRCPRGMRCQRRKSGKSHNSGETRPHFGTWHLQFTVPTELPLELFNVDRLDLMKACVLTLEQHSHVYQHQVDAPLGLSAF